MPLWRWLFHRSREENELEEELRFHLEQETQLRVDRGESPDTARRAARRDFGNFTRAREATREMWGFAAWERLLQDTRFALRSLRKNPAFTALALAALSLGIGATGAMFTVANSVLLRPLPFPDPQRLVMVWEKPPEGKATNVVQPQNFLDWRQRSRSFVDIAAMVGLPFNFEANGDAVQVPGMRVTAAFFPILGIRPALGHAFTEAEDAPNAPLTAVLSYGLWQRRFGGRAGALGSTIRVDGADARIIGVMPEGFVMPTSPRTQIYLPMQFSHEWAMQDGRNYDTVARLRPRVSIAWAQQEMQAIAAETARERPAMNARWSATVTPLMEQTVGDSRATLLVLMGAVAFVLLIACANVANLLLMRSASRCREMVVRTALGAGRWRLLHQLMVESLLLTVTGGVLGLLLASWGVPAILKTLPAGFPLPRLSEISADGASVLFTLSISAVCGLLFGILPALQVNRDRVGECLRQAGRTSSGGNRGLRQSLVVVEIGLAMLLVIGAGLMLRSFLLLNSVDPGFRSGHLLTFRMMLLSSGNTIEKYFSRRADLMRSMLDRIRVLPMVRSASSIHMLPMTGMNSGSGYYRLDRPKPPLGAVTGGDVSVVSDGYFATMDIRMLAVREFNGHDRAGSPLVAILNHTAAARYYPGESPLGKRMRVAWSHLGTGPDDVEIIGVAADVRQAGLDVAPDPCIYLPQAQQPSGFASLVVRIDGDAQSAIEAVRQQIHSAYASQGVQDIQTMDQVISDSVAKPRLQAAVLGIFGGLALLLACVGTYAVISYSVEQRMREMGIRVALGAAPAAILRMVLGEGLGLAAAGIACGAVSALVLTRYLRSMLYSVKPGDPLVYGLVAAVLVLSAIAGCYFPARRATHVDPAVVLREE